MTAGQRLRKLRQDGNMTQAELAAKLGVTEYTVCRYENEKIAMTTETIKHAAAIFNTCPASFLVETQCPLGTDPELIDIIHRVERLDEKRRESIKKAFRSVLDTIP